ncbi:MAG TPA: hypothetical protein VNC50_17485 [Planctomycetia bacterium]|nr:hypothetical protein [Planctomycetia bacterium]
MNRPPYRVNALSRFLLVVLRIAVGWHVAYEGLGKIDPHWLSLMRDKEPKSVSEPWTAEGYLRVSTGPLRNFFRNIIPDVHGVGQLDAATLEKNWRAAYDDAALAYALDAKQKTTLEAKLQEMGAAARAHFADPKTTQKVEEYKKALDAWQAADQTDRYGANVESRAEWERLEKIRRELTGPPTAWTKDFERTIALELRPEQAAITPATHKVSNIQNWPKLKQVNFITMWGLTLCGLGMVVGLFSRLSSLGTAVFLGLFYLSLPPWPGLPPVPGTEGNYLIVNKNLVEMIACLVLATLPTGAWGGVDAFIRGLVTRPLLGFGANEIYEREGELRRRDEDYDD